MIKRLIAIFVVVAVVIIVVVTAIRRDNFRSMVLRDEQLNGLDPEEPVRSVDPEVTVEPFDPALQADTIVVVRDSLTVEVQDSI